MTNTDDNQVSVFKQAQTKHRRRGDNPNRSDDLSEMVDFCQGLDDDRIIPMTLPDNTSDVANIYRGPIFGLKGFPGILYAPQALCDSVQLELSYGAVYRYCERPHQTNIDQCPPKHSEEVNLDDNMWNLWKEENRQLESMTKKQRLNLSSRKRKYRSFKKLSWATMGYHYNWTDRSYQEGLKSDMPGLVGDVATTFARTSLLVGGDELKFTPSASITNYYSVKSNMGGHRDDLELALDKPLISFSTGLPAVFLLGGKTKEDGPVVPILIRKGDVLCMGGDARMNYHAMARLIPATVSLPQIDSKCCPTPDQRVSLATVSHSPSDMQEEEKAELDEYLSQHRININVRQVYPDAD